MQLTQGIPDRPENQGAIDFLKSAPTKGLWMPLGKEVKTMQCWRCKVRAGAGACVVQVMPFTRACTHACRRLGTGRATRSVP